MYFLISCANLSWMDWIFKTRINVCLYDLFFSIWYFLERCSLWVQMYDRLRDFFRSYFKYLPPSPSLSFFFFFFVLFFCLGHFLSFFLSPKFSFLPSVIYPFCLSVMFFLFPYLVPKLFCYLCIRFLICPCFQDRLVSTISFRYFGRSCLACIRLSYASSLFRQYFFWGGCLSLPVVLSTFSADVFPSVFSLCPFVFFLVLEFLKSFFIYPSNPISLLLFPMRVFLTNFNW